MIERPALAIHAEGDVRSIARPDVALVFERVSDRWTHSLEIARTPGGPRATIARAVEWDADRDDPARVAGPVFQELHFQTDSAGRPQFLALGMSGRHHFSAAFVVDSDGRETWVSVDIADRCRDPVLALGSTYTLFVNSGELAAADVARIVWDLDPRRLTFASDAATSLGLAEAGRRATRVQALAEGKAGEPTRRWGYRWILAETSHDR